jgi:enterochelin esterase-like enzyme
MRPQWHLPAVAASGSVTRVRRGLRFDRVASPSVSVVFLLVQRNLHTSLPTYPPVDPIMGRTRATMAALLVCGAACSVRAQTNPPDSIPSTTIRQLAEDVSRTRTAEPTGAFWSKVRQTGTPLVEPSSRDNYQLVTFVFRGGDDVERVRLDAPFNGLFVKTIAVDHMSLGQLTRLAGTDVWYISADIPADLRAPYAFAVAMRGAGKTVQALDSLNPRAYAPGTRFARSLLELARAPTQPWRAISPRGQWIELTVESVAIGGSRPIHVYLPPSYDPNRAEPYPVLVGMDAVTFRAPLIPVDRILDYLASQKRIPETVLILNPDVGPIGDTRGYDPVVTFVVDEVLAAVRRRVRISNRPHDAVVTGTSRRGLVSSYVAFARPDAVGKVLSLSGSYYWRPGGSAEFEWLPRLYAASERRPIRLYVAAGSLETVVTDANRGHYLLATNRHMRDVLMARQYDFQYVEPAGVHSEVNWEDQLAAGLAWLWSRP